MMTSLYCRFSLTSDNGTMDCIANCYLADLLPGLIHLESASGTKIDNVDVKVALYSFVWVEEFLFYLPHSL